MYSSLPMMFLRIMRTLRVRKALLYASTLIFVSGAFVGTARASVHSDHARTEIRQAIQAMGGVDVLRSVHCLQFSAVGHRNMLEQSLRPDGPWWQDYFQLSEIRDFQGQRERVTSLHRGYSSPDWWLQHNSWNGDPYYPTFVVDAGAVAKVSDGKFTRFASSHLQDVQEDLAFDPIQLLLTALSSQDLHSEADRQFHGFTHHVVTWVWKGLPVRLLLNGYTELPEMVEWTRPRPYDVFWNPWGDVTTQVSFGMWALEPDGLRYPRQWTTERDGFPDSDTSITSLAVNPTIDGTQLTIPEETRKDYLAHKVTIDELPLGFGGAAPTEIEPGITHIPGAWNVNLIRQPDGIVVLEGPISSGYSTRVLGLVHKLYPGRPVKAVITTSDSWPHIGGLREYVARDIPIYALDLDKAVLERLFAASHRLRPDDLQLHPRNAELHLIAKRSTLGSGENRLELIPYRTETGERQMLVYFPEYKLLYTSDLFAPDTGDSWFTPEYLLELKLAVARENLDVTQVFGMHYDLTPYRTLQAALGNYLKSN